jgi:hypothetical protein
MRDAVTDGAPSDGHRLGLIVHHDDAGREYAHARDSRVGRLEQALDQAGEQGWLVVSMRDDWNQVFEWATR